MQQTDGTQELYFLYDDSSQPYALVYKSSATAEPSFYYYLLNVQGDVVALMNTSGTIVARYSYDPWGVPTVTNSSGTVMEQSTFIGNINPLRYRGYYYDTETGFYYLQSRYYDPAIGRFISADTFATTDCNGFLSSNMFAYCENNPVNNSDPTGEVLQLALAGGSAVSTLAAGVSNIWNPIGWTVLGITAVASAIYIGHQIYQLAKHKKGQAGRPEQKKQGRENLEKKKSGSGWEKRSGKRPRSQPRPHHPGRDHRKY